MSPQQKAALLHGIGGKFSVGTTEIYKPGPGELLIKIKSTALNPVEWKVQRYGLWVKDFPVILGIDAAGDVVEVGEGVKGFSKGDKVFFEGDHTNPGNTYQEYAISDDFRTAKIPPGISYDQAATVAMCLYTAWIGFYNNVPHGFGLTNPNDPTAAGKYANTPIVILGGSSSVGRFAIQLAKFSGFSPIIITASLKHESLLKSLGATHIIDRFIPISSLSSEVAKITSTPIKFIYDSISYKDTQQAGYDLLANEGKIAIVLPKEIEERENSGKIISHVMAFVKSPKNIELTKKYYNILASLLERGIIVPNRVEVIPGGLSGINEGLMRLENNQVSAAKLIIHPEETI